MGEFEKQKKIGKWRRKRGKKFVLWGEKVEFFPTLLFVLSYSIGS